jgi:putative membrane protein
MLGNIVLDVGGFHHMLDWSHMNWWGFPFPSLLFFVIFIVIVLAVIYLIIQSEKTEEKEIMNDAQKILDERYAKGEITRMEYIQAKEDLKDFKPK